MNETLLNRVNNRLEKNIEKNHLMWEIMTEASRVSVMTEIMTEELEKMKYENMNVKDWLAEAVDLGGCLIENVSKTVCKLVYCDGKLSHVHYRNEVIEIDKEKSAQDSWSSDQWLAN